MFDILIKDSLLNTINSEKRWNRIKKRYTKEKESQTETRRQTTYDNLELINMQLWITARVGMQDNCKQN